MSKIHSNASSSKGAPLPPMTKLSYHQILTKGWEKYQTKDISFLPTMKPTYQLPDPENNPALSLSERRLLNIKRHWLLSNHPKVLKRVIAGIMRAQQGRPINKVVCLAIADFTTTVTREEHAAWLKKSGNPELLAKLERFNSSWENDPDYYEKRKKLPRGATVKFRNDAINQFMILSQIAAQLSKSNPNILKNLYGYDPLMTSEVADVFTNHGFKLCKNRGECWEEVNSDTLLFAPYLPVAEGLKGLDWCGEYMNLPMVISYDWSRLINTWPTIPDSEWPESPEELKELRARIPRWQKVAAAMREGAISRPRFPLDYDSMTKIDLAEHSKTETMEILWRPKSVNYVCRRLPEWDHAS